VDRKRYRVKYTLLFVSCYLYADVSKRTIVVVVRTTRTYDNRERPREFVTRFVPNERLRNHVNVYTPRDRCRRSWQNGSLGAPKSSNVSVYSRWRSRNAAGTCPKMLILIRPPALPNRQKDSVFIDGALSYGSYCRSVRI